jgi:NADPH:quinone reductase-like Zn-dependent oxidoreductase
MKAAVYSKYGPPDVVQIEEIDQPVPRDNEVLIRVHATTVNRTDCAYRSAALFINRLFSGLWGPKKKTLGSEFAGEVVTVGAAVNTLKIGDRVFGCNLQFGAHAEYMVMEANGAIATIPTGITYQEAAAITEGACYAWSDLQAANIKPGQKVLINGATGAIGSAAVQLAKYLGAEVVAVCNTPNMQLAQSLGADRVIDYLKEDFTKTNQQFDVVFDAVGKSSFGKCKPILKKGSIYMSTELGPGSQNIFYALFTPLLGGKKVLFPIPAIKQKEVLFLKGLVEANQYKPVIDRHYTLDQIVEAYQYVETGNKTGNVVIG